MIGENLKKVREIRGLSLSELAEKEVYLNLI